MHQSGFARHRVTIPGVQSASLKNTASVRFSGYLFIKVGVSLFCGGLYLYALLEQPQIKVVIPFGGALLVIAWMALALSFIGHIRRKGMNKIP